jgi:hypothetical protein
VLASESSEPSESSTHPKALFPYFVSRISISILNMYLSPTYSSDYYDENERRKTKDERRKTKDESLKAIINYIRRCIDASERC